MGNQVSPHVLSPADLSPYGLTCSSRVVALAALLRHYAPQGLLRHPLVVALAAGGRHEHHWEQGQPSVLGQVGACPYLAALAVTLVHPQACPLQGGCASLAACQAQATAGAALEPPVACPCCRFSCMGGEAPPGHECGPVQGACPCNNEELFSLEVLDIVWLKREALAKGQA